ncbi:hypothetical protein FDECE_3649 [Fusarium decemcellulare]|nr:hypothetical protein FDECE_3649 [Fusarium decemcellulare]
MLSDSYRSVDDPISSITPHAPRPPKPVRLRLACDACTTAKVRCSKTHPCERCVDNGQECYYSASRRHGKRSRHRKTETEQRSSSSSDTATPAGAAACGMDGIAYGSEFTWEDNDGSPRLTGYQPSTLGNGLAKLDNWAFHDIDMTFDFDDTSYIPLGEPWKTPDCISNAGQLRLSDTISLAGHPTLTPMGKPAPAVTITSLDETSDTKKGHNCEALALSVLRSLHHDTSAGPSQSICKEPQDAANGLTTTPSTMPSIDTVLSANKAALTNLIPLLKCACARNPHMALLHSTILSKAIFWYRVAVTARCHAEGVELRPMKIQLGMLDLDDDDQATLQRAVLLRELRKAEKVMEEFDTCSAGEDEVPTWHASAIQNMRDELQAIIQIIKKGQGE